MPDSRISMTLLLVLACIQQERSTLSLLQVLDIQLAQGEVALLHLQESGLICAAEGEQTWCITEKGRSALPDVIATLERIETRTEIEELLLFCEKKIHGKACTHCITTMYTLLNMGRTPGAMICLEMLHAQMWLWHAHDIEHSDIPLFLECVFSLSDVSIFLLQNLVLTGNLIQSAIQFAMQIGDSRTLVLLQFLMGYQEMFLSSNNFAQLHATFTKAIQLLGDLGDKEMYSRASSFLVLFHFVKGDFQRAMENYELLQRTNPGTILYYMEKQLVLYAASSMTYLGQFTHAFGMLNSAIRTASLSGKTLLNLLYTQHLGVLLIYMGRYDDGMDILQSVIAKTTLAANPKIMIRVFAGIAYSHHKKGNIVESHQVFFNAAALLARHSHFTISFNYPWLLEVIGSYARHGLTLPQGVELDRLFLNAETSPSLMLQGQAMRFRAGQLAHQNASLDAVLSCLDTSLDLLKRAHVPIEIASTETERAVVLRSMGRNADAKNAEDHSLQLFSRYLWGKSSTFAEKKDDQSRHSLLDDCYAKLSTHSLWETQEEAAQELARIARQIFEAERSALFRVQDNTILCAGSCNISLEEQSSSAFAQNKAIIMRQIHMNVPFCSIKKHFTVICVPFSIPNSGKWLLYADSSLPFRQGSLISNDVLRHLGHFFALELRTVLWTGVMRPEPRQNDTVVSREFEHAPVLWGTSPSFRFCLERASTVATTDAPVLLLGESGVGKEVMAKFIHKHSNNSGPFVAVHPASISESLFESEFFGHEKGAFTGAVKQKIGLFELADQGTLFIDETGDIPLSMQIKLLRVLQEHTFMRVGGIKEIHSSFRLITATNRNLLEAVRCGAFREDLYYRLSVVPLTIPPLRERKEDIEELVLCFITYFSEKYRKQVPVPEKESMRQLTEYFWPGNLRELRNCVERAVILYSGSDLDLLVGKNTVHESSDTVFHAEHGLYADMPSLEELQKRYIRYVMDRTSGKVCGKNGAESILKMKRSTLYTKLNTFGIDKKQYT